MGCCSMWVSKMWHLQIRSLQTCCVSGGMRRSRAQAPQTKVEPYSAMHNAPCKAHCTRWPMWFDSKHCAPLCETISMQAPLLAKPTTVPATPCMQATHAAAEPCTTGMTHKSCPQPSHAEWIHPTLQQHARVGPVAGIRLQALFQEAPFRLRHGLLQAVVLA